MRNSKAKRKQQTVSAVKIIIAFLIIVIVLFPIYLMFVSSVKPKSEVFDMQLIPQTFTMDGYQKALDENLAQYFLNSLFVSATVTLAALAFHAMAGYVLARIPFSGRNGVFLGILSTMMIPFSVIMIPLFIMMKQFDWLNSYQGLILPAIPTLTVFSSSVSSSSPCPRIWTRPPPSTAAPNSVFLPKSCCPSSKSICITLAVAFFIANWNNYLWPLIVTQKNNMWVLQIALANFIGRSDTPWNAIMASGVITVIPIIFDFPLPAKIFGRGHQK